MNITIQTQRGTFIVPADRHDMLVAWLEQNAINVEKKVMEVQENTATIPRRLITE
jgi:hypothetical protein